jgi:hypothetical protein
MMTMTTSSSSSVKPFSRTACRACVSMGLPHVDMNGMSLTMWSSLWNAARVAQAGRL